MWTCKNPGHARQFFTVWRFVQVDCLQTVDMLGKLKGLRRLNLLAVGDLGDDHLARFAVDLVHLEHLAVIFSLSFPFFGPLHPLECSDHRPDKRMLLGS